MNNPPNTGTPPGAAPINTGPEALCLCFSCEFCTGEMHLADAHGSSKTGNQICGACEQALLEWNIAWDDESRRRHRSQDSGSGTDK